MATFTVHTTESAPTAAQQSLQAVQQKYGFVPNLFGIFAESPSTLDAYRSLSDLYGKTPFTPTEQQVVLISASVLNGCEYCVAAHSTVSSMSGVPADVIKELRNETPFADAKLEALRTFTLAVVEKRGWISEADLSAFIDAGYTHEHVLAVILGVTMKTLSNYTNHIADTPLDKAFASQEWSKK